MLSHQAPNIFRRIVIGSLEEHLCVLLNYLVLVPLRVCPAHLHRVLNFNTAELSCLSMLGTTLAWISWIDGLAGRAVQNVTDSKQQMESQRILKICIARLGSLCVLCIL